MPVTLLPRSQVKLSTLINDPRVLLRQKHFATAIKCGPIYLYAGGPGSGPHANSSLHKLFIREGFEHTPLSDTFSVYKHPSGASGYARKSGEWSVTSAPKDIKHGAAYGMPERTVKETVTKSGKGPKELSDHLQRYKVSAAEFNEDDHPRDSRGEFTSGDSGPKGLQPAHPDKEQWPSHIQALKLPPAWTGVKYSNDPGSALQATGKDAKGRTQYIYSKKFAESQAAAKFARIKELDSKFERVTKENTKNLSSKDSSTRENASCAALVMSMGIRPGSTTDTKAEKQAYGATTLEGRHVVVNGDQVTLQFVGKKGVDLNLPVSDPQLANNLRTRAEAAGPSGKLFPGVTDKSLLDYTHSLDGGSFKTKDFRTLLGTRSAMQEMKSVTPPTNQKQYVKAVKEVATRVSAKLGNTPVVALQSYISPTVFAPWRSAIGMK